MLSGLWGTTEQTPKGVNYVRLDFFFKKKKGGPLGNIIMTG